MWDDCTTVPFMGESGCVAMQNGESSVNALKL